MAADAKAQAQVTIDEITTKGGELSEATQEKLAEAVKLLTEKKDETASYLGEKKDQTVNYVQEKTEAAKQKGSETAPTDGGTAEAGKEKKGNFLQQAGDTVKNALGMGEKKDDKAAE